MKNDHHIVVICGPTASGKTSLALHLAKELPKANILSVDSRQVYQDLDIITGKDIPLNLPENIKIFGHDIFRSDERANLADFCRYSQKVINDSIATKTPLIIVGGTGLYLKAITQNLSDVLVPPNEELRKELEKLTTKELQDYLQKENPEKLAALNHSDFMNPRRLIRAIEISNYFSCHCEERSDVAISKKNQYSKISFHWIGLMPDKENIKNQIHKRVLDRIADGAIDEVKNLLTKYPNRNLPIYTSLGVSQIIAFLEGQVSNEELVETWTRSEVDYARRQTVWFKKQSGIVWYDKSTDRANLISQLKKIYQ